MSKTPLPWTIYDTADPLKIGIKGFDRKAGGMHVATVIMPENAELIVKAVNSHDALVKALRDIDYAANKASLTEGERLLDIRVMVEGALRRHVGRTP